MCRNKKKKKKEVQNQEHWLQIGWSASFASLHFPADWERTKRNITDSQEDSTKSI